MHNNLQQRLFYISLHHLEDLLKAALTRKKISLQKANFFHTVDVV